MDVSMDWKGGGWAESLRQLVIGGGGADNYGVQHCGVLFRFVLFPVFARFVFVYTRWGVLNPEVLGMV